MMPVILYLPISSSVSECVLDSFSTKPKLQSLSNKVFEFEFSLLSFFSFSHLSTMRSNFIRQASSLSDEIAPHCGKIKYDRYKVLPLCS